MSPRASEPLISQTPPSGVSAPATPALAEAQLPREIFGTEYIALLQGHMRRLRDAYQHPNRTLHYDTVLTALLLGFFNSTQPSLRLVEDLSLEEKAAEHLPDRVARSTLSDALRLFDPGLLLAVVRDLRGRVPGLARLDDDLAGILKAVIAADGSFFKTAADVAWAIAGNRAARKALAKAAAKDPATKDTAAKDTAARDAAGESSRRPASKGAGQARLNFQLDVLRFVPVGLSVSGADEGSEAAAFIKDLLADVIYVVDRNFVHFDFIRAVLAKGSDLVVRLKASNVVGVIEERPPTEADQAAGVSSDRLVTVPGCAAAPGFGERRFREVVIQDTRNNTSVRLLSTLLDVPAAVIGNLYRRRWQIEIFFRWLKCVAHCEHLISHDQGGMTLQFHVAVIAALLIHLRTGRKPGVYTLHCLRRVAAGALSVDRMLYILARHDHARDLEKARLARKRAAKAAEAKTNG